MPDQPRLIEDEVQEPTISAEEKAEYVERLRQKLQDPEFRQIEGFPIGDDETILELSDPPYYTACPNPFLPEIIARWQEERDRIREELGLTDDEDYQREPFASDVSEGKGNAIYNAHTYHTKVPHRAIMRYILHYTDPGDIIFDGFCGTGMTGVAAQLCDDTEELAELGYRADDEGTIYDGKEPVAKLGVRRTLLNDLSPAASFIAYNYNTPFSNEAFEREAKRILREVREELGWMYETWHPHCDDPNRVKAEINYTVWSEVFVCPECGEEIVYFNAALDKETFRVKKDFRCPYCRAELSKRALDRFWETYYDETLRETRKRVRFRPVLINYQLGNERLKKVPDKLDFEILRKIENTPLNDWFPVHEMPDGERKGKDGYHLKGIYHLHDFYFRRALLAYARMWRKAKRGAAKA